MKDVELKTPESISALLLAQLELETFFGDWSLRGQEDPF